MFVHVYWRFLTQGLGCPLTSWAHLQQHRCCLSVSGPPDGFRDVPPIYQRMLKRFVFVVAVVVVVVMVVLYCRLWCGGKDFWDTRPISKLGFSLDKFGQVLLISRRMCDILYRKDVEASIPHDAPLKASMFRASKQPLYQRDFQKTPPQSYTTIYSISKLLTLNLKTLHKEVRTHTFTTGFAHTFQHHFNQEAFWSTAYSSDGIRLWYPHPPRQQKSTVLNKNSILGFPGVGIFTISTQYPLYTKMKWAGEEWSPDLSWLGRCCDFWKHIPNFHPCFGWMPIDKPPDLSRWIKPESRNDCATSPCQSCKWSRRPQSFLPDLYDHQ